MPRAGRAMRDEFGRYSGRKIRYQRKYCEVQTLLKVTNARVWASIVVGRSCLDRVMGRRKAERRSCGIKARDSKEMELEDIDPSIADVDE